MPVDVMIAGSPVTVNPFAELASEQIDIIQTLFVDNSSGTNAVSIHVQISDQTLYCPAGAQAIFPVFSVGAGIFTFSRVDAGTLKAIFVNVPMTTAIWSASSIGGGGSYAFPSQLTGSAWTDYSSTIALGGTSQQAIAANAARKRILIANPDTATETLYVNFGGAASAANSIALFPGGTYVTPGGETESPQSIYVLGATSGHVYIAKEM